MEQVKQSDLLGLLSTNEPPSMLSAQSQDAMRAELGKLMLLCKARWPFPVQTDETISVWFEVWLSKASIYKMPLFRRAIEELVKGIDEFFPDPGKIEKHLQHLEALAKEAAAQLSDFYEESTVDEGAIRAAGCVSMTMQALASLARPAV